MRNIYKIMIWNQTKECMDREQMRLLQGARLKSWCTGFTTIPPFYRDKMQQMGLTPDDIDTIDDIVKLPFTTKQDLRDNYPYGLFAAPPIGDRPAARLVRDDRQTHGGRLHAPRSFDLVGVDRTLPDGFRHHARRPVHGRLRLRPFSRADWVCTTGWNTSERPSSRCLRAIRPSTSN